MTTLLIMLPLLIGPWLVCMTVALGLRKPVAARRSLARLGGCVGLAALFGFAGVGHFLVTEGMVEMLPAWLPLRREAVYASGVLELVLAAAVLWPKTRRAAGWAMLVLLVAFLPVNVWAAVNHVGLGGHKAGPVYLWIRVPLQVIIAAWAWWFAVRQPIEVAPAQPTSTRKSSA